MSDQVSPQPAGQAANPFQQANTASGQQPVTQPAGEPGQEQSQYLTRTEAEALRADILRQTQSLVDKTGGRIEKEVAKVKEQFSATGINLTQDQEATLRENLAKTTPSPTEPVNEQPAQAGAPQAGIDPALAIASRVMQSEGVTILDTDPEFKNVAPFIGANGTVDKPYLMLQALNEAIAQKRTREAAKANPNSRISLGSSMPAGSPLMTSREAWRDPSLFK